MSAWQQHPPPDVGIHLAALTGDLTAVRQHIAAGSDLDERDPYGSTPLIIAATFGRTEVARALLEGGADPDLSNDDGGTPLHTAAFLGRVEIVEALLEAGADKYLRDGAGNTPLGAVAAGEFLVIRDTGAYGAVMSSSYNTRLPVAEVMVKGDKFCVIRPRPGYDSLISLDRLPIWLRD